MRDEHIDKVSVRIGSQMYGRFEDLPNTVPHVLAEFIDNAIQSFRDKQEILRISEPGGKLTVKISIFWDESNSKPQERKAIKFIIEDNAGGIAADRFVNAFEPAKTPDNNSGLNEFGMGLKTAACWLGTRWTVQTKAIGENVVRTVCFDQQIVTGENLDDIPVKEEYEAANAHFTKIEIESPTKNVPTEKSLHKIQTELSSIYRNSLRSNELNLIVNDEPLSFTEYPILNAPYYKHLEGPSIIWKKDIDFKFKGYRAKGFIGILKELKSSQNGIVLSRRGRVIIGAEDGKRYFPRAIFGAATGTFRYKRIFGELELEGFAVAFNKNDIQDKENLEALMEVISEELRSNDFDMLAQADHYRPDKTSQQVKKLVSRHDAPKAIRETVSINTEAVNSHADEQDAPLLFQEHVKEGTVIDEFKQPDIYEIDGKKHLLRVKFIDTGTELCWLGVSRENHDDIVCNINIGHEFFKVFGKPTEPVIALLKTFIIARYTADNSKCIDNDKARAMLDLFNEYIKKTKV